MESVRTDVCWLQLCERACFDYDHSSVHLCQLGHVLSFAFAYLNEPCACAQVWLQFNKPRSTCQGTLNMPWLHLHITAARLILQSPEDSTDKIFSWYEMTPLKKFTHNQTLKNRKTKGKKLEGLRNVDRSILHLCVKWGCFQCFLMSASRCVNFPHHLWLTLTGSRDGWLAVTPKHLESEICPPASAAWLTS